MHRIVPHWPAFLFALLVGFSFAMPTLLAWRTAGIPFSSPANIRIDDEPFYFARIHEVLDGHPMVGNAYLAEHKEKPPAPAFLAEVILAFPIRLFGVSVVGFQVVYDILLPALAVLLTYAMGFRLSRIRWLALLATVLLFWGLLPNEFGRAVSPQFNFLFWLSLLFLVDRIATAPPGEKRTGAVILAAANLGVLFYLYAYYWTFFLVLFVLGGTVLFLRGDRSMVRAFGAIVLGGVLIALPSFLLTASAFALPEYGETLRRLGLIATHIPSGIAIVVPGVFLVALFALFFFDGFLPADRRTFVLGAGVLASVFAVNQHVVTGQNLEFSSHYLMPAYFSFMFASVYLTKNILLRAGHWRPLFITALIAASGVMVAPHIPFPARIAPPGEEHLAKTRLVPALDWVEANVAPDAVVYAPGPLSELIPVYTSANVYFAAPARLFFVSDAEIMDRFLVQYAASDMTLEFVRDHFREVFGVGTIDEAAHQAMANRLRRVVGLPLHSVEPMPTALVERARARSQELRQEGFEASLKRYRADWVIWDRRYTPDGSYGSFPFLEHVADHGDFSMYRVH